MTGPNDFEVQFTVMGKVSMTSADSAFVSEQIEAFGLGIPTQAFVLPFVKKLSALPLYVGWGDTIGLRASGEIIRWPTEGEFVKEWSLDDPISLRMALVQGAKSYPRLSHLVPPRPPDARDCRVCQGTGNFPVPFQNVICACGGTGWLEQDSTRDSEQTKEKQ